MYTPQTLRVPTHTECRHTGCAVTGKTYKRSCYDMNRLKRGVVCEYAEPYHMAQLMQKYTKINNTLRALRDGA